MKRFFCCVLSFVFAITAFAVVTKAQDNCVLKVETAEGAVGKTVTLGLSVENNPGISGGMLVIEYDADTLRFEGASVAEGFGMTVTKIANDSEEGVVQFGFVGSYGDYCEDGEILRMSFVLRTVSNGFANVKVRIDGDSLCGTDYKAIEYQTVDGGVKVSAIESMLGIKDGAELFVVGTVVSVPLGMTVGEFNSCVTAEDLKCYSGLGQILSEDSALHTDYYVICNYRKLRFAVRGDVNGDGAVSTADYLSLKKTLSEGAESAPVAFVAGDVNADKLTNVTDLYTLKLMLIEKAM